MEGGGGRFGGAAGVIGISRSITDDAFGGADAAGV